ncbi:MAG: NADH-quinone oxidoreductase subunit NuoN [Opitutae bacterium]|nr:NADH-quinone oxidoreductase subunit NuoN [Opitutae bacterium]
MDYTQLLLVTWPDLIVVLGVFAALSVDYTRYKNSPIEIRSDKVAMITSLSLLLALAGVVWQLILGEGSPGVPAGIWEGQIVLTPLTLGFKALVFALALFILQFARSQVPNQHVSEYFGLILLSTLGMGFLITTQNLLMLFISIELISISLYGLTAFQNSQRFSVEAGIKYFAIGGVSSAFLLFGISYLYGATNALAFDAIVAALNNGAVPSGYLWIGSAFLLVGLGFKIAAVPFHLWAPDVYQCAPVPVAAWIATGSKIASFFVLVQLFGPVLQISVHRNTLIIGIVLISLLSMALGNIGALRQTCVKRLLAYSSIAHAGYILIGFIAASREGNVSVLFYSVVYAAATLGAFAIIGILSHRLGREALIKDFNGCWKKNPGLSLLFMIFILSLAGIPPLSGFFGKFYLFMAAIGSRPEIAGWSDGFYWLVAVALLMSAVSLFYYIMVLKAFLVSNESPSPSPIKLSKVEGTGLVILALLVLGLGILPMVLVDFINYGFSYP